MTHEFECDLINDFAIVTVPAGRSVQFERWAAKHGRAVRIYDSRKFASWRFDAADLPLVRERALALYGAELLVQE